MAQPSGGLHSLATIIKRLEAATSRLEDLAVAGTPPATSQQASDSKQPVSKAAAAPSTSSSTVPDEPKSVRAFDEQVVNASLQRYLELSKAIGGPVETQAESVKTQMASLRSLVLMASACSKPATGDFATLLGPLQKDTQAISKIKDDNRTSKVFFNHLSTIAEGAQCVGWVTLESKPGPFVAETKDSAVFYANRLVKEYKDKDAKHVDWTRAYLSILDEMKKYVLEHHPTGLVWNAKGIPVSQYSGPGPAASAGGPPPPPPPPPPPAGVAAQPVAPASGAAAVMADLNKGTAVTAGLRHVDKSEMTHKNPSLRGSSVVPAKTSPTIPKKPMKPAALAGKKPAKFALEGNKWVIEHHENESNLTIEGTEINQIVTVYGCKNCTLQVKGKVNAVNLLNSSKTSLLVSDVISSINITASPSFAVQITGKAPTLQIDSTDSGQVYLSKECLDTIEIVTAKCSAINVSVPVGDDGDFVERAVPEMLRSVVKGGKLVTSIVEHSA